MKISFVLDKNLYDKIEKSAKDNGRSDSGEIRFRLEQFYQVGKK